MAPLLLSLLGAALIAGPALAATTASRFTYYNLTTPLAAPCDLYTVDNEIYASTFLANKLIYIDRTAAKPTLTEIDIPYPPDTTLPYSALPTALQGAGSCVIQPGGDGNVYFATGIRNALGQYNPSTKKFKFFQNSVAGNLQPFNDAWPGAGGMWFTQTTANVLSFFNYTSEKITSYTVPTLLAGPVGVQVVGGNVWICEFTGNKIAKFNVATSKWTEYNTPLLTGLGPAVMRAATQRGKYIWFTAILSNAIGRVNTRTGAITMFPNSANLGIPIEDTNDGKGNVWFSTAASNTLNYLIPKTGKIVEVAQPDGGITSTPVSLPPTADIAMHWVSQDNSMWFTELAGNRIGRYQLQGSQ